MRAGARRLAAALVLVPAVAVVMVGQERTRGDEPGPVSPLRRLFRLGGNAPSVSNGPSASPAGAPAAPNTGPIVITPPTTPALPNEASPRIVPQPRTSRPATEADPLVSRMAIGRSDNGSQFGMFLQVYADGTVLDGEGVHHVGRDAMRPLIEALRASDVFRVRGHCGGPPTDFIEQVYLVVYERSLGRLRASAFSFSGNPEGCDHAIRHIQAALDAIQAKISGAPVAAAPPPPAVPTEAAPLPPPVVPAESAAPLPPTVPAEPAAPLPPPVAPASAGASGRRVIPLTPVD